MTDAEDESLLPIGHVFHPTDFSHASEVAFAHALRVALAAKAALTIFHVAEEDAELPWSAFPGVRSMLAGWGLLPPGSPKQAVPALGIEVEKVAAHGKDPLHASLDYLDSFPAQLIVLSTHGRDGLPRWLHPAVAEPLARAAGAMTLFIPHGARGFVSAADGAVGLREVLLPVDVRPRPQVALNVVGKLAQAVGATPHVGLLHVGPPGDAPALRIPRDTSVRFERLEREGDPLEEIVMLAAALPADLVVMTTAGHHGFLDALRGSTTERALRRVGCPLLAIPEEKA
jgi:nucleotide-binding universal stress UspA family protein